MWILKLEEKNIFSKVTKILFPGVVQTIIAINTFTSSILLKAYQFVVALDNSQNTDL